MYYFVNDHLGTPQKIVDSTNQVVWAAAYLPFGKAQVKPAVIENNLRFPGQYYDAESGLHYNWNRYYDPETGRYITADPIGLAGGINLYAYVMNNPMNLFDLFGLVDAKIIQGVIDAVKNSPEAAKWIKGSPSLPVKDPVIVMAIVPKTKSGWVRNANFIFHRIDPGIGKPYICVGIAESSAKTINQKLPPGVISASAIGDPTVTASSADAHEVVEVLFEGGEKMIFDWHATLDPGDPKISK